MSLKAGNKFDCGQSSGRDVPIFLVPFIPQAKEKKEKKGKKEQPANMQAICLSLSIDNTSAIPFHFDAVRYYGARKTSNEESASD